MGFSNGGSVARSSAQFHPETDTNGVSPKAYIMVYGGCHSPVFTSGSYNPALLYIAGSEDRLFKATTCLRRKNDSYSDDIEVVVIDGAYHMFDGDQTASFIHAKWGPVTVQADSSATDQARRKVVQFLKRVF